MKKEDSTQTETVHSQTTTRITTTATIGTTTGIVTKILNRVMTRITAIETRTVATGTVRTTSRAKTIMIVAFITTSGTIETKTRIAATNMKATGTGAGTKTITAEEATTITGTMKVGLTLGAEVPTADMLRPMRTAIIIRSVTTGIINTGDRTNGKMKSRADMALETDNRAGALLQEAEADTTTEIMAEAGIEIRAAIREEVPVATRAATAAEILVLAAGATTHTTEIISKIAIKDTAAEMNTGNIRAEAAAQAVGTDIINITSKSSGPDRPLFFLSCLVTGRQLDGELCTLSGFAFQVNPALQFFHTFFNQV